MLVAISWYNSYILAYDFSEGLTVVNKGALYDMMSFEWTEGKWGFIDKTGKEVIPFKYDGDITNYQKKEPK